MLSFQLMTAILEHYSWAKNSSVVNVEAGVDTNIEASIRASVEVKVKATVEAAVYAASIMPAIISSQFHNHFKLLM
jgi:hypothetical protein